MKLIPFALAFLIFNLEVKSQTLLKEINPTGAGGINGAQPGEVLKVSSTNTMFFRANNQDPGLNFELWKSDGTAAGTVLVKDINSAGSSFPSHLTDIGGVVVFSANDNINGVEVWKSDGTNAGTTLLANINTGAASSIPDNFTRFGETNDIYFFAENSSVGKELYKITNMGAHSLVKDINSQNAGLGSSPSSMVYNNNKLYFAANDGVNGIELWTSDGTGSGTLMLKDINLSGSSAPTNLFVSGGKVYFSADNGINGRELWVSDGTESGTTMLRDINTTAGASSNPANFIEVGSTVYFTADNGVNGVELWKTDGTGPNTLLIDVNPNAPSSNPTFLTAVGTNLYFAATTALNGRELHRYDGTNLTLVKNIGLNAASSTPEFLANAYGRLYFSADDGSGKEMWVSDGSAAGTVKVSNINSAGGSSPRDFTVIGNQLLFFADNGVIGQELYTYTIPNTPVILPIADQNTFENTALNNVPFTVNSSAGFAALTITGFSLNTTKVPNNGISIGGTGSNRTVSITPNNFQTGDVGIVIQVCDNSPNCTRDTFNLNIIATGNAPILTSFTLNINEDERFFFTNQTFLDNYFDPESDALDSIRIKTLPANGKLFLNNTQITSTPFRVRALQLSNIRFVPDTNYFGTTQFTWDAKGGGDWSSNESILTFSIAAVNDPPVILQSVQISIDEDNSHTFSLANFNNANVYYDAENEPIATLRITSLPNPANGHLINLNDTVRSTNLPLSIAAANISNLRFVPRANYFGNASLRFRVSDGTDFSNQDTVKITVNPINDAPIAANFSVSINEDQTYNFTRAQFEAVYFDIESTPLQILRIATLPLHGTLKLNGVDVTVGQDIASNAISQLSFTPDQYWFGATNFQYSVRDNALFSVATYIVTINVAPINNPPLGATIQLNGQEDVAINLTEAMFSNVFSNPFFGEPDVFSGIQVQTLPANARILRNGTAILQSELPLNLTNNQISQLQFSPNQDWNGTTFFLYKMFDGIDYALNADTVRITLTPVNDAPEIFNSSIDLLEDNVFQFIPKDFTDNFIDVDGDLLSKIQITQLPSNGQLHINGVPILNINTDVSSAALGSLTYAPNQDYNGVDSIKYVAYDPSNAVSNVAKITITVLPVNDAPEVSSFTKTGDENQLINFFENDFTNAFFDVDGDDVSVVGFANLPNPSVGALRLNGVPITSGNLISKSNLGNITFQPAQSWFGETFIRWRARDLTLFSTYDTLFIEVNPVNDAPTVTAPQNINAFQESNEVINNIAINDIDVPADSSMRVFIDTYNGTISLASTVGLSFSKGDGTTDTSMVFTGTKANLNAAVNGLIYRGDVGYFGFDFIDIKVSDRGLFGAGGELFDSTRITVDVTGANDTAFVILPDTVEAIEGQMKIINGISIDDIDPYVNEVRVSMNAINGTISLNSTTGLTFISGTGSNDKSMVFRGLLQWVNPALNNMRYTSEANFVGIDFINFSVIDSVNSGLDVATDNASLPVRVSPRDVVFTQQPLNASVCEELSTTFTVAVNGTEPFQYQWYHNGDALFGKTQASLQLNNLAAANAGTYYCMVTNPAGSFNSGNASLVVYSKPQADFNYTQACTGQPISFTNATTVGGATISNYTWDMSDGTSFSVTNPVHTYNAPNIFEVEMRATSNQGCRDTISKQITVVAAPVASFTGENVCLGDSTGFTNNSTVFSGSLSYSWNFSAGANSTLANPKHRFTSTGAKTVTLTAINNNVCSTSTQAVVNVYAVPNANFTVANICLGEQANFVNTSTISNGTISNSWSLGNNTQTSNSSPTVPYANHGTYNVQLITESNNGCRDTIQKNLIVYPRPIVSFQAENVCLVDSVVFNNTTTIVSGGVNYLWTFGDNSSSALVEPIKKYNTNGNYNVKLVAEGVFGCKDSASQTVSVFRMPNVSFETSNVCFGTSVDFQNNSSIPNGVNSYNWRFGDGTQSANVSPVKNYSAPGLYTVRLRATTNNDCRDSLIRQVRVYPKPVANFSVQDVCSNDSVLVDNKSTVNGGGYSSLWTLGDGSSTTGNSDFFHSYPSFGSYTISLVVTADSGCVDSTTRNVQVFPMPMVSFEKSNLCFGNTAEFINNSTVAQGSNSYQWFFGDGSSSANVSPFKNYSIPDNYAVKLRATTVNGCKDSLIQVQRIFPQPIANFSVGNVCENDSVFVTNSISIFSGAYDATWLMGNADTLNTLNNFHYQYAQFGAYNIKLKVVADSGCADSVTKQVQVFAMPQVGFTFEDVCFGNAMNFTNTSSVAQGTSSYTWNFGDGGNSANISPTRNYAADGAYGVSLLALTNNGCKDSVSAQVRVHPQPTADFSVDNICENDSIFIDNASSVSNGAYAATWQLGDGNTNVTNDDYFYKYSQFGAYSIKLKVVADSGCADSLTKQVQVFAMPQLRFIADDVCFGQPSNFINQSNIASGTVNYTWDFDNGTTSNNVSTSLQYSVDGTYQVKLLAVSNNNCRDSLIKPVLVKAFPVVAFSATNVCFGDSTAFTNNTQITSGTVNYVWTFGDGNSSTDTSFNYLYAADASYQVKLIATGSQGCVDSLSKSVQVYPVATLAAAGQDVACNSVPTGQITIIPNGGTPPFQYSNDGGVTYQAIATFSALQPGGFNLQTIDANGCLSVFAQNPFNTSQPPVLVANITASQDINCFGGNDGFISVQAVGGQFPYSYSLNSGGFQANGTFVNLPANAHVVEVVDGNGCNFTVNAPLTEPADPISASYSSINLLCRNVNTGEISIQASGSVGGYEYSIDNGSNFVASNIFQNLGAGSYTVVVRDTNGCSTTSGLTITQPQTAVSLNVLQLKDVACFGESSGEVRLTASGGTGAKQFALNAPTGFQISNSFANLTANSYTAFAEDFNGCRDTIQFVVSQPSSALNIDSVEVNDVLCFGGNTGTVEVFASGGTGSYRYNLSNSSTVFVNSILNNVRGGNLLLTVKDSNNCEALDSIFVNEPSLIEIDILNVINEFCQNDGNGSVELSASGGVGAYQFSIDNQNYSANTTIGNLGSQMYAVFARDGNNCVVQTTVNVDFDNTNPIADFDYQLVGNTVLYINQSQGATSYFWDLGNGDTSSAVAPTAFYSNLGTFEVILLASNVCGTDSTSSLVNLNPSSLINLDQGTFEMEVYPNPTIGDINLKCNVLENDKYIANIFSAEGKLVWTRTYQLEQGTYQFMLPLNGLPSGIYQLSVGNNSEVINKRIVIQ